jgi:hypothetical protein
MASKIIKKISIKHSGDFIVDTVPPDGSVIINNGDPFTKSATVSLSLEASDETTDIASISIRNIDITTETNEDGTTEETVEIYPFLENIEFSSEKFWNLTDKESIKVVEVNFIDYAGNESVFISNSAVRKLFTIEDEEVVDSVLVGDIIYTATDHEVYIYRSFSGVIGTFTGIIVDLEENSGSLYLAMNGLGGFVASGLGDTSQVFIYLDGEFISTNTFDCLITDMASYNGDLYVVLENGELYKKDSSAWFLVAEISNDVSYIDGKDDYLYIVYSDIDDISLYNGESFADISMFDNNLDIGEDESSSDSSSSNSSSSTDLESSLSMDSSSSSTEVLSTSSQTISTSSDSTVANGSSSSSDSSSSLSLESSSSKEFIGSDSSIEELSSFSSSIEELSSFSSSTSSNSTDDDVTTESSDIVYESSSSGDICMCNYYLEDSLYVKNISIEGMSDKYGLDCNLYGRLVTLNNTFGRVYLYHSDDRDPANEVARSIDFHWKLFPQVGISLLPSNETSITGTFDYVIGYDRVAYLPHEFTAVCDAGSESSSFTHDRDYPNSSTSSNSQDLMLGNGTETNPYRVTNCEELQLLKQDPEAYYYIANEIDCIETFTNGGYEPLGATAADSVNNFSNGFEPIGSLEVPWKGSLDGGCYRIRNLYINRSHDNVGLFGHTDGAHIFDINLDTFTIIGNNNVGALIGYAVNTVVDKVLSISSFEYDYIDHTVEGVNNVGGIIGSLLGGSSVTDVGSRVESVTGVDSVGGIVGYRQSNSSIIHGYSTEAVVGSNDVGGLVGLVGSAGESAVGVSSGEVISSYWDVEASGVIDSADGEGKTTSQMHNASTYDGWDIPFTWAFIPGDNDDYLYLVCSEGVDESSSQSFSSASSSSQSSVSEISDNSSSESIGIGTMSRFVECVKVAEYEKCAPLIFTARYEECTLSADVSQNAEIINMTVESNAVYVLCPDQT